MGFMTSYKRLDKLCRDMNGVGITGYISDMQNEPNGAYFIPEWKSVYNKLKRYRHIRNQIAHESYANEENMSSKEDELWLDNFYNQIIKQADPLASLFKISKSSYKKESDASPFINNSFYEEKNNASFSRAFSYSDKALKRIPNRKNTLKHKKRKEPVRYGVMAVAALAFSLVICLIILIS